jgi:hypothetical protein
MKNIIIFAIITLGVIIAAIWLPMHYPAIALVLYAIIWIMIKFEVIQKMIIAIKKSQGKNISELYWEPIEKILPRIQTAMIVLCVYATVLLTAELTPLVKPLYWSFTESDRVWLLHIAIMIALIAGSQLSNEYRAVKNISYIVAGVLFIIPTFFEGKVWKIQQGDEIVYEVPAYAHERVKWYWKSNKPYQVKINDDNVWFENGKVPSDYINPQQVKKITIRTEPADKPYIATVEIWSRIDL